MINITTRRYYLSEFMYDNYQDNPTNLYNGFFVDLTTDTTLEGYIEFWLGCDNYTCKDFMFSINEEDCCTDEKAQTIIENNVCAFIEDFVNKYFNDCEECVCDRDYGFILDMIDMHNDHANKMDELAEKLIEIYPDVENTAVDDAFSKAYNGIIANAISLCCEANSYNNGEWMTDEDWHVVKENVEG